MVAPTMRFLYSVGAIHESPVFICDNRSFSGCQGRRPTSNDNSKATNQPVILSAVELLPSDKRGKSAKRKAVCGISFEISVAFQRGCYIYFGKPPKFVRRSLRRFGALVLYRYSLNKTSTPLRMTGRQFVLLLPSATTKQLS